jgi:hypothetical protein
MHLNDKPENVLEEATFNVLSQHLPGRIEENHKTSKSGQQSSLSKFKLWSFKIQSRSASYLTTVFMHSLHDPPKMNAYRAEHVCLST